MPNPANREEYARWLEESSKARDMYEDWSNAETLQEFDALYVEFVGHSRVADEPGVMLETIRRDLFDYILSFCHDAGVDTMGFVGPDGEPV